MTSDKDKRDDEPLTDDERDERLELVRERVRWRREYGGLVG